MRRNIACALIFAFTLLLSATIPGAVRAESNIKAWNPPADMAWDTQSGKCVPTKGGSPFLQDCYYGPKAKPSEHVGLAFFRRCGPYRQKQPFLVVDFDKNSFIFYSDPSKEGARTYTGDLPPSGSIDPDPYLEQLPAVNGPCWAPQGDPA